VRPWASPTDVTTTNPGAPTDVKSGSVGSYSRAAFCDCAISDRNSDKLGLVLSPTSDFQHRTPSCARRRKSGTAASKGIIFDPGINSGKVK